MTVLENIARARIARDIAELDLKRVIIQAAQEGEKQVDIAQAASVTQPSISEHLANKDQVRPITEGFSGADPYEICQRYHLGHISEEQLFDELTRWEYLPQLQPEHILDDGEPNPPGTWEDVELASSHGYISDHQYSRLLKLTGDEEQNT